MQKSNTSSEFINHREEYQCSSLEKMEQKEKENQEEEKMHREYVEQEQVENTENQLEKKKVSKELEIEEEQVAEELVEETQPKEEQVTEPANFERNDEEAEKIIYKGTLNLAQRRALLRKYANENYIKLNFKIKAGFCNLCNVYIKHGNRMNVHQIHVAGALHKKNLELKGLIEPQLHEPCMLMKIPVNSERLRTRFIYNWIPQLCINGINYISLYSYLLLYPFNDDLYYHKLKCYVCDILFLRDQYQEHCKSLEHKTRFKAAEVMCIREQFIREIKPSLYHCGTCNIVLPFWESVKRHLKKYRHLESAMNISASTLNSRFSTKYKTLKFYIPAGDFNIFYLHLMQILTPPNLN